MTQTVPFRLEDTADEERQRVQQLARHLVSTSGWSQLVLPFLRAYKRAATDASRSREVRTQPGVRDYLDGQCAMADDLVRYVHGLIADEDEPRSVDVEDRELYEEDSEFRDDPGRF